MADSTDVTAGTNATATQYNNLRKDLILAQSVRGTETYGTTTTVDWSDKTKGKVRDVTMTGNITTLAFSNDVADQFMILNIIQGGSGGYTITNWPSGIKWPGNTAPPLSTTVGAIDTFLFHKISAGVYRAYFCGFDIR